MLAVQINGMTRVMCDGDNKKNTLITAILTVDDNIITSLTLKNYQLIQ